MHIMCCVHALDEVLGGHERKIRGGSHTRKREEYQTCQVEVRVTTFCNYLEILITPNIPGSPQVVSKFSSGAKFT